MKVEIDFTELLQALNSIIEKIVEDKLNEFEGRLIKKLPERKENYLTITEVAALTNVTRPTIYKWIEQGLLRDCKKGIKESDINRFMSSPQYEIKQKRKFRVNAEKKNTS